MAILQELIPDRLYEQLRDRIAEILIDEIQGQIDLGHSVQLSKLYVERTTPIDKLKVPCIVVSMSDGQYDNRDMVSVDGNYTFFIDAYTKSKATADDDGDTLAAKKVHKLIGVCQSILTSSLYDNLGFDRPFISESWVETIAFGPVDPANRQSTISDSQMHFMGRLQFKVRVQETSENAVPEVLYEFQTQVKVDGSSQGYIFTGQNTIPVPEDDEVVVNVNGDYYGTFQAGTTAELFVPNLIQSKTISLADPLDTDNIPLFETDREIEIIQVNDLSRDGQVDYNLYYAPDQDEPSPSALWDTDRQIDDPSGQEVTVFDNPVVPADNWVWIKPSAVENSTTLLTVNIIFKYLI